jgi:hypothetical protein
MQTPANYQLIQQLCEEPNPEILKQFNRIMKKHFTPMVQGTEAFDFNDALDGYALLVTLLSVMMHNELKEAVLIPTA